MPDNINGNDTTNSTGSSDILSDLQGHIQNTNTARNNAIALLKSIDQTTKQILQSGGGMSMSNAQNMMPGSRGSSNYFQSRNYSRMMGGSSFKRFTDSMESALIEELVGREFKNKLREVRDKLARDIGVSVEEVPAELGKALGKKVASAVKDIGPVNDTINYVKSAAGDMFNRMRDAYVSGRGGAAPNPATTSASTAGISELAELSVGTAEAGAAIEGMGAAVVAALPELLLVAGAIAAVTLAMEALEPAIVGTKKLFESLKNAANRYEKSREQNLKDAEARMKADIETLVKEPFDILKSAAQNLYDAWDQNVRTINGTQGYNKDQLYSLIGNFADRLRSEGLERVVSTDTVTNNLAKVLESGLSGQVAEEFAYLATKLNAAVPTEDFFNYAGTYSSIAANAIQQGKSQSEAILDANTQLESFASNLLYASREISGGFTTGLKDANTLFQQSVQIAQAGKTNNAVAISGVMTAVSAIVGAVAPDLATSMTDAIYKAATGGNSSDIVALRSLAGINASNTEFLKQLADNPQRVFATLFENLGNMQKMSEDAYMEVAEGLSSVFGVSMDAFARVDFNYLAQAISSMNTSNKSLADNLSLLASGETTTNAEQMRMQQINEYMWEEGLSYVMDNAAARSIQEHMWDEQLARELMESTYGVEIQGSALEFLEGIRKTIDNILGFLNPFKALSKLSNVIGSITEAEAQAVDIRQLLELGKLGGGNARALYSLTTRNTDLNLTDNLIDMMGGVSVYNIASTARKIKSDVLYTGWNNWFDATKGGQGLNALYALASTGAGKAGQLVSSMFSGKSAYSWGSIGKSTASALSTASSRSTSASSGLSSIAAAAQNTSATAKAQQAATQNLTNMLNSMQAYVDEAASKNEVVDYDAWVKSASSANHIGDFSAALENAGLTEEAVKSQFDAATTQAAQAAEKARKAQEEAFWADTVDLLTVNNTILQDIFDKQTDFFKAIVDYFIDHLVYSDAYSHTDVTTVQKKEKEKSETAVYALAQALTKNTTDLLDPTVQTNVILAQILKLVNVLVQQGSLNTESGAMSNVLANMATGNWEIQIPKSTTAV